MTTPLSYVKINILLTDYCLRYLIVCKSRYFVHSVCAALSVVRRSPLLYTLATTYRIPYIRWVLFRSFAIHNKE